MSTVAGRRLGRPVGHAGLYADPVADSQVADVGANLDHPAGALMAEHHRLAHDERADLAVQVVVQVAAADADGVHRDADIIGPDLVRQVDVAQRELLDAFENQGLHVMSPSGLRRRFEVSEARRARVHAQHDAAGGLQDVRRQHGVPGHRVCTAQQGGKRPLSSSALPPARSHIAATTWRPVSVAFHIALRSSARSVRSGVPPASAQ